MNISPDTSKKILELLNQSNAKELKSKMNNIDPNALLELFKKINPTDADIKKAEEKIKSMSVEELMGEVIRKMKG